MAFIQEISNLRTHAAQQVFKKGKAAVLDVEREDR